MPSRASLDASGSPVAGATTLFKKHKTLPHPRPERRSDDYRYVPPTQKPRDLSIDTGVSSIPSSSDTSSSPRTLKHASRRIGLPPTPPTHFRQSSGNHTGTAPESKYAVATPDAHPAPGTPVTQRSPPTPDFTPPRTKPPLAFRPAAGSRYSSSNSRSDSFKTARENPYSSDEDEVSTVRPGLPSARPSENDIVQIPVMNQKRKEVGLGLGLESDEGATTPRATADSAEFAEFEWLSGGDEDAASVEREWDYNLMRNVTVRKRGRESYKFTDGPADEVLENDIVSPTAATKVIRGLPLHERIAKHRLERDEKKFGERIAWPMAAPEPEYPSTADLRRLSAMSGRSISSTVIEALVVEATPLRRKTLRHTKKYNVLRDFSDQSSRSSAPNSVVSTVVSIEPQHKLMHKRSPIPDRRHRSLASSTTVATTTTSRSSSGKSRKEVLSNGAIPVLVIPDRRSSTRSSKAPSLRSTSSQKTKRSMSLGSAPLSNSSKFNDPAYSQAQPRKRTMSESAGSGHSVRTIDFPPNIPTRRSSLSAPTSRNTSRAGSLTAESLKAHNLIQQKKEAEFAPKPAPVQPSVESQKEVAKSSLLNVDHNGDPFFGNRPSTQVTPFSQTSCETTGTTAVVSDARAVSIFPHQNKSVLVVEQQSASSHPSPPAQPSPPKLITSQPQIAVNGKGPITPPQVAHPMDEIDSPLRNPRAPPEPPSIKFIPPTPAALTPGQEENKQLGFDEERPVSSDSKTKRGMSLMRRAFSNRRQNSEPVIPGPTGLMKRTFSLTGRRKSAEDSAPKIAPNPSSLYPSVEDRPADVSKLHPFWRPAHFWDDLEDHDSLEDDEFGGRYPIIDNRPAPPKRSLSGKLKRTFAILPIKDDDRAYASYPEDRRTMYRTDSGNMRIVKQRSNSSLRRDHGDWRRYNEAAMEDKFGYGFKEGNGGRVHTIPGIGVRIEYVGWSNMKRRLSERRRKERSEKLRGTISGPKGPVQSGVDDVLRRKRQV